MEIEIMSIDKLLQKIWMQNAHGEAILFITMRPNYYNFGHTWFHSLNIPDTDEPEIRGTNLQILQELLDNVDGFKTLYVCCDAGISRSPAVALFLAHKLVLVKLAEEIEKTHPHYNKQLFEKLMGIQWK